MLSVFAADRARASGLAIALWFFFRAVVRLADAGFAGGGGGEHGGDLLPYLLLLNPADVFRVLNGFARRCPDALWSGQHRAACAGNPWLMGGVMLAGSCTLGIATWVSLMTVINLKMKPALLAAALALLLAACQRQSPQWPMCPPKSTRKRPAAWTA